MTYKNSKQRELILEYMQGINAHVSAEEIYENINKEEKKISLATVYRNLGILEDLQKVKKIALPQERYVYDKTCNPHYHFYCEKCKTLYDLDEPYKLELDKTISDNEVIGKIDGHDIIFKGVCRNCK
ncbi:Fe2+ or Zn2+ uptake regulation protein [Breznakia sp. PF5-3]|uniref:Fur family transcriptional regulator n=1 Tax=unclassified Breznakia TaxID=2623764 RepID=UPI0024056630|nr:MULTISPECIES: transcriptional repressor [unclassified Breznakia]MDF9825108.1 Fe2+ or Zn2+ uptake regulation protein [Breznakia sp. PM6-1]MDF9835955.1 Fe2+ or Zn2+ uptake regulation protein [Breznakia sp. PF5-3]MDF9837806.1 Fe2+ or Zn2+ uptake regulation protein [Breznakia sp. PFB2-8]MDF9859726.1 Fe2+ or Zn2+ uptake regulation protein [Breznakia sp. PH5-24]